MNESETNKQRNNRCLSQRAAGEIRSRLVGSPRGHARSLTHQFVNFPAQRTARTAARTVFVLLLPLLTVSLAAGCAKPSATTPEDVVDYVRSAYIRAEVQRLDPEPQAYLNEVMKHYRALEDACEPMRELADSDELWPLDDDAWRDPKKIAHRADVIFRWFADDVLLRPESSAMKDDEKVDDAIEKPVTRSEHLSALLKAIDSVPEAWLEEKEALGSRIREELWIDSSGADAWYGELAHAHRQLLVHLLQNAYRLDPAAHGLTFASNEVSRRARELWEALAAHYTPSEVRLARAEATIEESAALRDEHLREKKELYVLGDLDEEQTRRYRRLGVLFRFEDQRNKNAKARKKELEAPGDDTAK